MQNQANTPAANWHGKPYYSLNAWCLNTLGRKCYKIALNAHMSCPNRDGTLDTRGCIFCSAGGSGEFAEDIVRETIASQLQAGLTRLQNKFSPDITPNDSQACLIAYFQAYTNTYAPVEYLRQVYAEALECPLVCGISIGTRPDCLPAETLQLLEELQKLYPHKFIWIELGLQTIHESTAAFIRRGYALPCFEESFYRLKKARIPVIVHLILGLPNETPSQMLESVEYIDRLLPFGVKLQLLHILQDTDLGTMYLEAAHTAPVDDSPPLRPLEKDEYLTILIDCIRHLAPEIVIHRLTGDGPRKALLAPAWSLNKRDVLNSLHSQMRALNAAQGDLMVTVQPADVSSRKSCLHEFSADDIG